MKELRTLLRITFICAGVVAAGCHTPRPREQAADRPQATAAVQPEQGSLHPRVKMETSLGSILLELDAEKAPATVLNFLQYAETGFYDGTVFHRVVKDSMIQGGGYTSDMKAKDVSDPPAVADIWVSEFTNRRGTIAMIRGGDRSSPATAQFYINVVDNVELDGVRGRGVYAVFGKVVGGLEALENIRNTPVGPHPEYAAGHSAVVPTKPVVIKSVRLVTPFATEKARAAAVAAKTAREDIAAARIEELGKESGAEAVTTESGLRYIDSIVGDGRTPLPTEAVQFHYRGTLLDGTEFESTYTSEPVVREVGRLIRGLQEGLTTMSEGGRRTLIIPPELGFGEAGIPGRIPPNATLVFEVELIEVRSAAEENP